MLSLPEIIEIIKEKKELKKDKEVAKLLGIEAKQFATAKSRNSIPHEELTSFCNKEGWSLNWLLSGEGPQYLEGKKLAGREALPASQQDEYVYIPLYNIRGAAGHGAINEKEEVADVLAFKAEWVKTVLRANKRDLFLMFVDGDSMEPMLRPGDIILVDKRDIPARGDGIYVLRMDDVLLIKRLQKLPGGIVQVTSDNTIYKSFEIRQDQFASEPDRITIIGRVVWAGRRF